MRTEEDIRLETEVLKKFKGCENVDDVIAKYKELIRVYHSDNNRDNNQESKKIEIILNDWKGNPEKVLEKLEENNIFKYDFYGGKKRIIKLTKNMYDRREFRIPIDVSIICDEACWNKWHEGYTINVNTLIFSKNVNVIGDNAFRFQDGIKKVIFENNNELCIYKGAFSGCENLEEVVLPENVILEGINSEKKFKIFEEDYNLKEITLPNNYEIRLYESKNEFCNISQLCTVLPDTIETIHWKNTRMSAYLFKDLKKSYWVNDIEKVKNTFLKLKNIYGLENVIEIGEECFAENSSLEKLSFPNAKLVEKKAFFNCTGLKEIFLEKVEEIKEETFSGCKNLKRLYLPHVKEVKKGAFKDCINLESIILDNVKVIGEGAFSNCKSLKEVHIPKIEEIGNLVFKDCLELTCIEIPDTIKLIGDNIFKGCTKLAVCIIKKECEYLLNETSFFDCEKERKEIICNPTMSLEVFTFSKSVYLEKQLQTIGISIDIPSNKKIFSVTLECPSETVLASLSSYDRVLIKVNCYNITQEEQEVEIKATVSTY